MVLGPVILARVWLFLICRFKPQRHTVHAIAQAGWGRAIGKHMAQVGVTAGAMHLSSAHEKAAVRGFANGLGGNGGGKAGPTRA